MENANERALGLREGPELAKRLLRNESARRDVDIGDLKAKLTLTPCENYVLRRWLTLNLNLGHRTEVDLIQPMVAEFSRVDHFKEAISEMLDSVGEIEDLRAELIDQVQYLRAHLRRKLANERRKGLKIAGAKIGLESVYVHSINELAPILILTSLGSDLKFHTVDVQVWSADDIDAVFDEIREDLSRNSRKMVKLEQLGAVGQVHPLLVYEISRRNLPLAETLKAIHADPNPWQRLPDDEGARCAVRWNDGIITATFHLGDNIAFQCDRLTIKDAGSYLPANARDRHLADVIDITGLEPFSVKVGKMWMGHSGVQEIAIYATPIPFDEEGTLLF